MTNTRFTSRRIISLCIILSFSILLLAYSFAQTPLLEQDFYRVAKAEPDECYSGVGEPPGVPPCAEGEEKTNQAYIWALTKADEYTVWFGTIANTLCRVMGGLQMTDPIETDDFVCEFGESMFAPQWGSISGDWRPPRIYSFNKMTSELIDHTTDVPDDITTRTSGWRAAVAYGGLVLFGGPGRSNIPGQPGYISMVAFDAESGDYIASTILPPYTNIRKFWVASDGNLYAGVRRVDMTTSGPVSTGRILKWINNPQHPLYPFHFVEVGMVEGDVAELCEYNGRLWITTWPIIKWHIPKPFGVYRSPVLRPGGLDSTDLMKWEKVWNYGMYDKDPLNGVLTGGGAIRELNGWLYFGTMHVPMLVVTVAQQLGATDLTDLILNGHRAISIFRLREIPGPQPRDVEVQCLWGREELPVFDLVEKRYGGNTLPTGYTPLYGDYGIGNRFNNYTWSMASVDGWLYVGTMDWFYIAESVVEEYYKQQLPELPLSASESASGASSRCMASYAEGLKALLEQEGYDTESLMKSPDSPPGEPEPNIPPPNPASPLPFPGFDLFATDGNDWVGITGSGFDNITNYGARNLIVDGHDLFLGTANPMNLHPYGGWELWRGTRECSTGQLKIDRRYYRCVDSAFIGLRDCDLNTSSGVYDTAVVYVESGTDITSETVILKESGLDTGVFEGYVNLDDEPTTAYDGIIQVADGDTLRVLYQDAHDEFGRTTLIKAESKIDCLPPTISNVRVISVGVHGAVIGFDTDEVTFGLVNFGYSCDNLTETMPDIDTNEHIVALYGLDSQTTYSFVVSAMDYAGNTAYDDNNGNCYSFTTITDCERERVYFDRLFYSCEDYAYIWLEHCDANTSASVYDTAQVYIECTDSYGVLFSSETLTLTETSQDSGVFEGELVLTVDENPLYDDAIQVADGYTLSVKYSDETTTVPLIDTATIECNPPEIRDVEVIDIGDTFATIHFKTSEITVGAVDYGTSCGVLSDFQSSPLIWVEHFVPLSELTPATTYYFQVNAVDLAGNFVTDNNGGACYSFTTLKGCSDAELYFDREVYLCDDISTITLNDCGENLTSSTIDTVNVSVVSTTDPVGENVILYETGPNTGVFIGSVPLKNIPVVNGDGIVEVSDADTLTVQFNDPDDGMGNPQTVTDEAYVDCRGPHIIEVQIIQVLYNSAIIQVKTDEPSVITLDYGTTCGLPLYSASAPEYDLIHTIHLSGLTEDTLYKFTVTATDELGFVTFDDNDGVCYEFRTYPRNCSDSVIFFDREVYATDDTSTITLADCGQDFDPAVINQVSVTVTSDKEPLGENITLYETAPNSGIFVGSLAISSGEPIPDDGVLQVNEADTISAVYFDPDDGTGMPKLAQDDARIEFSLTVISEYDSPQPSVGTHIFTTETLIHAYMQEPIIMAPSSTTRYVCTGWLGEGSVPATGNTTSVTFLIDTASTITWQWKTQHYLLAEANPPEAGWVALTDGITTATGWYDEFASVDVLAIPAPGWQFNMWTGDLSGSNNPETVTMDAPKSIVANFSRAPIIHYTFDEPVDWMYKGETNDFDVPTSESTGGHLGMNPAGSTYAFSYWYSPDVTIPCGRYYRSTWTLSSSVSDPDLCIPFRLRVNQKQSWQGWSRYVDSRGFVAPTQFEWKNYALFFNPVELVPGDDVFVFSFDSMSFDPGNDVNSWIYLEELIV
ncbi:hypothetical protein J7M23_05160, partial [Candidatus Sumerlaeota bacterium]|nr:hypothetical protein [Candidatus Sumerlaeota bacterium]